MNKFSQDTAMGIAIILASLIILFREDWFLTETSKGRRLVQWLGSKRAIWALRCLLLLIAVMGGLLACGVIRPLRWE